MLSIEDNERFTRVSPGEPMGELLRRYWMPIAALTPIRSGPPGRIARVPCANIAAMIGAAAVAAVDKAAVAPD